MTKPAARRHRHPAAGPRRLRGEQAALVPGPAGAFPRPTATRLQRHHGPPAWVTAIPLPRAGAFASPRPRGHIAVNPAEPATTEPQPHPRRWAGPASPIHGPQSCLDVRCSQVVTFRSGWKQTGDPTTYAWDAHTYEASSDPTVLDRCNGRVGPDGTYRYHATATFPYILGCYAGTPAENAGDDGGGGGGGPGGGGPGGRPPPPGGAP
ncbi:MAG: YHYH protein [Alphaproteobacteria bacterium]|nr:YHYH protein [Alphaproteobacteria bacterium]